MHHIKFLKSYKQSFYQQKNSFPKKTSSIKQVAWVHIDRQMILTIHRHVISRIPRYSITYDNANTWLLHINQAQQEDRGLYMCQVNTNPMISQVGYLQVVGECIQFILYLHPSKLIFTNSASKHTGYWKYTIISGCSRESKYKYDVQGWWFPSTKNHLEERRRLGHRSWQEKERQREKYVCGREI